MDQKILDHIENAFKVMEKEGNKVSRDGVLPAGKNADAGHDVASFNAGMRYAVAKLKTSLRHISLGKYEIVEFPRQGQHALPPKDTTVKKAVAVKASKPAAKAKTPPAKKTPATSKKAATITDIGAAKSKAKVRKVVRANAR